MLVLQFLALASPILGALPYKTHDISSLLVEEAKGVTYRNPAGQVQPLEKILAAGGANSVKLRLWVNPPSGEYNLTYGLKLGQRVKAAGLKVILNLHYSDNWADPGKQVGFSLHSCAHDKILKLN